MNAAKFRRPSRSGRILNLLPLKSLINLFGRQTPAKFFVATTHRQNLVLIGGLATGKTIYDPRGGLALLPR
jgi:hypothetical protein